MQKSETAGAMFFIDVGGTFTDCIGILPGGIATSCKVLSSARIKGQGVLHGNELHWRNPAHYQQDFFAGFTLRTGAATGGTSTIRSYDPARAILVLEHVPECADGTALSFELFTGEAAPVLAIRLLLQRGPHREIGPVDVRLATTRATNALLERKGARTILVCNKGLGDLPEVGDQSRPDLFAKHIRKPAPLHSATLEIGGRIAADGSETETLPIAETHALLQSIEHPTECSLAVALLHSWCNGSHERQVRELARACGFRRITLSSELTPTIGLHDRCQTAIVNAYLAPVLEQYLAEIQQAMPLASIHILSSAGALVRPAELRTIDTIVSGPAGGVVACAAMARSCGVRNVLAFDMGGTSTDVSRFDGAFEYQFAVQKAGIKINAPMLAIETVAAGGGSICRFDGRRFLVGPHSAGADPGPACYGRGGPLTITDMNLIIGAIDTERFPFPLDRQAVYTQLDILRAEIITAGQGEYSHRDIAAAFLAIANERMAGAIASVSRAKGYDTAGYTLMAFGGAAAQHAVHVAELLDITTLLIPPYAGVLSAWGAGMADFHRIRRRSLLYEFNAHNLAALDEHFHAMEAELRSQLLSEGLKEEHIGPPQRTLELRYKGTRSSLPVSLAEGRNIRAVFEQEHQRLYAYIQPERPLEIAAIRLGLGAGSSKPEVQAIALADGEPQAARSAELFYGGKNLSVPVYEREQLRAGQVIRGPALLSEAFSSIVVAPQWHAEVGRFGEISIVRVNRPGRVPEHDTTRDPLRLELFNRRFSGIAEQMGITLRKTALSVNVKERLDFSCALLDSTGRLIVNAPHIPVHLGAMSATVQALLRDVDTLHAGDMYLSNSPDAGGSHLPDLTLITPIFDSSGTELRFFTASRAHHAEIGGLKPGSAYPFACNLAEEGVVLRNLRIVSDGEFHEDVMRRALLNAPYPSRAPEENLADIRAAIAANRLGANLLEQLIAEQGWPVVHAYMNYMRELAEQTGAALIRAIPDGEYRFCDYFDNDAPLCIRISVQGAAMHVDFSGSAPVQPNSMNANRAIVESCILYCLRLMLGRELPLNSGLLAPVAITLPTGMLNPPAERDPLRHAAVVGGNVEISQKIVDVFLAALGVMAACQGSMNNLIFGNARFGYYETIGGGSGAGPDFPGAHAVHSHMTNTRLTDVEVLERNYPVRVHRFGVRRNSGGAGLQPGGDGIIREIEFLAPLELSILSQRRLRAPFGMQGGTAGAKGINRLRHAADGTTEDLAPLDFRIVQPGDILSIATPGGGGWGKPPAAIRR